MRIGKQTRESELTDPNHTGAPKRIPPALGLVLELGWRLGLSVLLGVGLGLLADNWLGTAPVLTLVGTVLGVGAAFYAMWDIARDSMNRQRRD